MNDSLVSEACSLESLVGRLADEFLRRQEAGERPDVEEYVARCPQAADLLRKVLASLQLLQASLSGSGPRPADNGDEPSGTLGDFRLGREIGRGGMGIVYEAEQMSLGRRVALKVLPFAATMDPRQLQRFHNEARAAAGLHHTNIVPVYAVGCERGVHYYAMQLIEGRTLADTIAELRQRGGAKPLPEEQPTEPHVPGAPVAETAERTAASTERTRPKLVYFRRVAEWGIQAAEALDHAHQLGIVHRDVKPANLLVDATDRLWVTDFGLAQFQSDARLTMTGDLVGTLRYMSPEQALAQRVVIDHRTDVYSLGATLYELLTQRPAYLGKDRQELLRQIAFEEPKAPRQLSKPVPAELETIVLKAMEKNPAERYATAKDLADDLRRWLNDEPIRARRPGVVQRLGKWRRRHRAAVAGGLALLLLAAIVLGAGNVVVGWSLQKKNEALHLTMLRNEELNQTLAALREEREKSRNEYLDSLKSVNDSLAGLEELAPDPSPTSRRMRDAMKQDALTFYRDCLRRKPLPGNPAANNETGWGYVCLGNLCAERGEFADAIEAYNAACAFFTVTWWPPFGEAALRDERPGIEKTYREALRRCREGQAAGFATVKDFRWVRFRSYYATLSVPGDTRKTAYVIKAGSPEESVKAWRQELALAEVLVADYPQGELALDVWWQSFERRSQELMDAGQDEAVAKFYLDAAKSYLGMTALYGPKTPENVLMTAKMRCGLLAGRLTKAGELAEAFELIREEMRLQYPDERAARDNIAWTEKLAKLQESLPFALRRLGEPKNAIDCLAFAKFCTYHIRYYVAAVHFYEMAFAADPYYVNLWPGIRTNAASFALRAGRGEGTDAAALNEMERASLRRLALDWMRAHIERDRKLVEEDSRYVIGKLELPMQVDSFDFASDWANHPEACDLPEAERSEWQKLRVDVANNWARAWNKARAKGIPGLYPE